MNPIYSNMSLCMYRPTTPYYGNLNILLDNSIDANYYILISYFIGIFTGIFISFEYFNTVTKEKEVQDSEDEKDEDYNSSDSESSDSDSSESSDSSDSNNQEGIVLQVRDSIDTLYICTNDWANFVTEYSIFKRIQVLYPTITKQIINKAMSLEPNYTTGSQHNKKGYRYITAV